MTSGRPCPAPVHAALEEWFLGRIGGAQQSELLEHLAGCAACRGAHERLVLLERALCADGDVAALAGPSPLELERLGERVVAGEMAPDRRRVPLAARLMAAATAALALSLLVVLPASQPELTARGPKAAAGPSVRAFVGVVVPGRPPSVEAIEDGAGLRTVSGVVAFTTPREDGGDG